MLRESMQTMHGEREKCYQCFRPKSSCMCQHISPIDTQTKFVILMHPKEFKKVKNGTGHLTHRSLSNAELFVGIDFTQHARINAILDTHESYILYPSKDALNLSKTSLHVSPKRAIFIIDSTWACALKMMRESRNLHALAHISFEATKPSAFKIKEQPKAHCLSTIESTLCVLECLNKEGTESLSQESIDAFLNPFHEMINYQLSCLKNPLTQAVRYKPRKG